MADKTEENTATIDISNNPLKRGDKSHEEIIMTEPKNGVTKGLSLQLLMMGNVEQMAILLPRITTPAITKTEFTNMSLKNQMLFSAGLESFLE